MLYPSQDREEAWFSALLTSRKDHITPEYLSKRWKIGLELASRTLKATTHQFIRTTGALTKRFKTDRAQLRYKQMMKLFGSFYCDFLKSEAKSVRGYIGGVVYTNKLAFYKFVPCTSEPGGKTGQTLRHFLNVVGLPHSMHADNHVNFKE